MNPLLRRLVSLRRKARLLDGGRGLFAGCALLLGAVALAGLLDWSVQLPSLVRALLLTGTLGATALVVYRYLFVPLAAPCDDLTLALRVEEKYPELNDSLASTVQFLKEGGDAPSAGSETLRKQAIRQALAKAERYDFGRILDRRSVLYAGGAALAALTVVGHFAYHHPQYSTIALRRLAEPFAGHTWTQIDAPDTPSRVAVGQPFVVRAVVDGVIPSQARVEIEGPGKTDKTVAIKKDPDTGLGVLVAPLDMTQHKGRFKFRVLANDGTYPPRPGAWHPVEVLEPPQLANLDGLPSPQVELYPPAYTEVPPLALAPGTRHLELFAGTHVVLRAATDRPIQKAWVAYRPENPLVRTASLLSALVPNPPLQALSHFVAGQSVWGRTPAELDADGRSFTVRFTPPVTGVYVLHLEDEYGLAKDYTADLRVLDDPLPLVKLHRPATTLTLLPDAEVAFRFQAEDEIFALRSAFVEYHVESRNAAKSGPHRIVLYDGPDFETALPFLLSRLAASPLPGPPLHLRPKKLELATTWHLRNQFKEGDKVFVEACADDFCDLFGPRPVGRSHQVELHIVGKFELAKNIDDKLAQAQQDLLRLQKWQKEAGDMVKELLGKDKVTQKEVDRLVEAEQLQRQIKERIGSRPDEGMRGDLAKLQQLIKDNQLKDTEAQEQAGMLKGALDQLAQQELQQIEPALAQARRQMTDGDKQPTKGDDKQKNPDGKDDGRPKQGALQKAEKLQASAQKSLDELVKAMNPWASLQQVKGETRDILERQKQIEQELRFAKQSKEDFDKHNKSKQAARDFDQTQRDDLKKKADQLSDLAKRAEDLNQLLQDVGAKRAKEGDKETAERLRKAEKIAKAASLPGKMRDAAKQIKNVAENPQRDATPPNHALQQQEDNVENLEKMLSALEGKQDDVADRLQKKREKAGEDLDKLRKKMKQLEEKVQQAEKLENPQERLQKLRELAKEHEELKNEIDKNARQLARLEEQRAANELKRAGEEVEKTAKKLNDGEPAEENRQEAEERVQKAQAELKESEEELARERLAKIADRLKGLKERQDAAVERSKEFHEKIVARKTWTRELGDTLEGNATAQQGLAKETESLKEKLKEAKVFEHILDRAAQAMNQAAEVMTERKLEGLANRQYDPAAGMVMEKEELDDENLKQQETVRFQNQASKRLDRLLDAVKQELAKKQQKKKDDQAKQEGEGQQEQQGGLKAADGIPAVAQLKALKAEQQDVNERTEDFARRHPAVADLTPEQRRELEQIQNDQSSIQRLFQEITSNAEKKGEQP